MKPVFKLIFFCSILFISIVEAKTKDSSSLLNLKRNLKNKSQNLVKIKSKLKVLNKSLGSLTTQYMKGIESQKVIESRIEVIRSDVDNIDIRLKELLKQNKKIVLTHAYNSKHELKKSKNSVLINMLMEKALSNSINKINSMQSKSMELKNDLKKLEAVLERTEKRQTLLDSKISYLEKKKEGQAHRFKNLKVNRDKLYRRYKVLKSRPEPSKLARPEVQKIRNEFLSELNAPLKKWAGFHIDRKGLTFMATKGEPVIAPEKGKVVYSSNLGAYGYLIIIKHDLEMHTLVLGEINPKIKEGQLVSKGEDIGVIDSGKAEAKLYFEVRKSNETISTQKWMKSARFTKTKRGEVI